MAKNRSEDDLMENEAAIPEPPTGTATEVARVAWQVAWSASNAAAGYHASIINHLVAHEKTITNELKEMRRQFALDFATFRATLIASLHSVGIRIDLSPSGEHAAVRVNDAEPGRDRVASSHDLEVGLAEVNERVEEELDERLRGLKAGSVPSERVRAMLSQERAQIEAEQQIMRLELEKKQLELSHASEVSRFKEKQTDLAEANARWLRVAFMIAGGVVAVLGGLLVWALTGGHGKLPGG